MKMKFTPSQEDLLLLKWPLLWLVVALLTGLIWYGAASRFREDNRQALQAARADRLATLSAMRQIEEDERIVRNFSERYRQLQEEGTIGGEDRLALVETLERIRAHRHLYPMQLEIKQQTAIPFDRLGGPPDTGMSLRSSRIVVRIPLLHEEDFLLLLAGLNEMRQGIFVTEEVTIKRAALDQVDGRPELRQNLGASVSLLWLTMANRTDADGREADGEQAEPPPL